MKSLPQILSEAAGIQLIERGALELFHQSDAEAVVNACELEKIGVLGIETFRLEGSTIVPQIDWIADYSDLFEEPKESGNKQSLSSARQFVHDLPAGDYFLHFTLRRSRSDL
jgi:hypothetical protein